MPKPRPVERFALAGLTRVDAATVRLALEPLAGGAGFWLDLPAADLPAGAGVGWVVDVLVPVVVGLAPPPRPGRYATTRKRKATNGRAVKP